MSSKKSNFVSDNKVFILGGFYAEETNEMIGDLTDMVMNLPLETKYMQSATLASPYDTYGLKNPIIDVLINSNGGETSILKSISTLLSIAKNRGAIIRTTVLGKAHSCGSMLAIQGTPGFRIMYEYAQHLIHFGSIGLTAQKEDEIEAIKKRMKTFSDTAKKIYTVNTNLTEKNVQNLMRIEHNLKDANWCLQHNLCDWIIDSNGNFRGRSR